MGGKLLLLAYPKLFCSAAAYMETVFRPSPKECCFAVDGDVLIPVLKPEAKTQLFVSQFI